MGAADAVMHTPSAATPAKAAIKRLLMTTPVCGAWHRRVPRQGAAEFKLAEWLALARWRRQAQGAPGAEL
jgi:hypothetical protein